MTCMLKLWQGVHLDDFFYSELHKFYGESGDTIFVATDGWAVVKDHIKFHLYISTAPCGDGAQFFSRGWFMTIKRNRPQMVRTTPQ